MKSHWFPLIFGRLLNPYESQGGTLGRGRLTSHNICWCRSIMDFFTKIFTDGLEKSGGKIAPNLLGGSSQDLDTWFITMVIGFVP